MQLIQLFEANDLKSYKHWKKPSVQTLKDDFNEYQKHESSKWEIRARSILTAFPMFTDFEGFKEAVASGTVLEIDKSFANKVQGMSASKSISSLKSLVGTYAKPKDIKRLSDGFKNGDGIPMPIIVRGLKGMWMLSGNARCNTALILGFKPKVVIIDLMPADLLSVERAQ